jgi:membrane-associated phospholipid phosphatase
MKKKKSDERRQRDRRQNRFLPLAIGGTGGIAVAAVAFWFFARQAERVVAGRAEELDETLMDLVHQTDSPVTRRVMQVITQFGSHALIGGSAGLVAINLSRKGKTRDAWTIVMSTAGAMALNTSLKAIFQRKRPQEMARHIRLPRSHSFPSGHSLLSAATYPIIIHQLVHYRSTQTIVIAHLGAAALVGSVGFSRVYFGVHFPSDVFGGFAAGLGWLGLTSMTHSIIERDIAREQRRLEGRERRAGERRAS